MAAEVNIIRSHNRVKTVSAKEVDGVIEVRAPASMSDADLAPIIKKLTKRLERRAEREALKSELDDEALNRLAQDLNKRYFGGKLKWTALKWVTNQRKRYGSCTPANRTIRISHELARMPRFVLEYVLVHELAHLREANHGPKFWELVYRYPRTERARGYLMAVGMEEMSDA